MPKSIMLYSSHAGTVRLRTNHGIVTGAQLRAACDKLSRLSDARSTSIEMIRTDDGRPAVLVAIDSRSYAVEVA